MKKVTWEWDKFGSSSYNVMAAFESTLINMGIMKDYSDIEDTEDFVSKYGVNNERSKRFIKQSDIANLRFKRLDGNS